MNSSLAYYCTLLEHIISLYVSPQLKPHMPVSETAYVRGEGGGKNLQRDSFKSVHGCDNMMKTVHY